MDRNQDRLFTFVVVMHGRGVSPDFAWQDAVGAFAQDPGATPEACNPNDMIEDIGHNGEPETCWLAYEDGEEE